MPSLLDNWANNCVGSIGGAQFNNVTNPLTFTVGAADLIDPGGVALAAPFSLTVWDAVTYGLNPDADPAMEIVYTTSRAGVSLTATRGQEGTAIVAHTATVLACMASLTAGGVNMIADALTFSAYRTVSTNTGAVLTDKVIVASAPCTITLLAPGSAVGVTLTVKALVDNVTISGSVEGQTGMVLYAGFAATLFSDGVTWRLL